MLPAQLTLASQPFIEDSTTGGNNFEALQGYVLVSLGFVVGVEGLQSQIQPVGKGFDVLWLFGELDEPLMAALSVFVHEDGCCCVFPNLCVG